MSTFRCNACGRAHEGVVEPPPSFPVEEIERRKAAWIAAEAKLDKAPDNEHFERDYTKAWLAYGATLYRRSNERLPDTLTTKKGWHGVTFVCEPPCETKKVSVELARVLEPWEPPPRCERCRALVHADHLEDHRRYRCQPGLHQPPLSDAERDVVLEDLAAEAQKYDLGY